MSPDSSVIIERQTDRGPIIPKTFDEDDSIPLIDSSDDTNAESVAESAAPMASPHPPEIHEPLAEIHATAEANEEPVPIFTQTDDEEVVAFDDAPEELTPEEIESNIEFVEEPVALHVVVDELEQRPIPTPAEPVGSDIELPRASSLIIVDDDCAEGCGVDEDFAAQASPPIVAPFTLTSPVIEETSAPESAPGVENIDVPAASAIAPSPTQASAPPPAASPIDARTIDEAELSADPFNSFFDSASLTAPMTVENAPSPPPPVEVPIAEPRQPIADPSWGRLQTTSAAQPPARSPQVMLLEDGPPAAAFSGCPHCRKPMTTGAIVCLACGYNILSGDVNPDAIQRPITHLRARSTWRGPMIVGSALTLATLAAAYLFFGTRAGFIGFGIAFLISVPAWFAWSLVDARDTEGAQLKIWLVPGYIFAWIFRESRSRYLRAATIVVIAITLAFVALGYEWKRIEREQRREQIRQTPPTIP